MTTVKKMRRRSTATNYIYALRCPVLNTIRYVGKSNNPDLRLYYHLQSIQKNARNDYLQRWLRQLTHAGFAPELKVLFTVPEDMHWKTPERFLIAAARFFGLPITNTTTGGEGVQFISTEHLEQAKKSRAAGFTDEVKARMSASMKAAWARPDARSRMVSSQLVAAAKPERLLQLAATAKMPRSEQGKANQKAAQKAYSARPEVKAQRSAMMKARLKDPKYLERVVAASIAARIAMKESR